MALALVLVAGCTGSTVLTVNGERISRGEFNREVERRLAIIRKKNPGELEGSKGGKLKKETERQVATETIKSTLMEQQAKKLGVAPPAEEVERRLEAERTRQGAARFEGQLAEQGLSEDEYRHRLADQALVEVLGNDVSADMTATEDEAETFYLSNKGLFSRSPMIHVAHILLDSEGQARIVEGELKKGADFATLAKSLSRDYGSVKNGGDLGWVEKGTMDPDFESAAFALGSGQVSGVVKASDGYHVIKVLERREAYTPPFAEVKNDATTALLNRKKEEKFQDWLRTVYANAEVKVDAGLGRWDPRLGMVAGVRS